MEKEKLAVITGATSGLGLSYAKYFAKEGYNLFLTGRREEIIEKRAEELRSEFKVEVEVMIVELSNKEGIDKLIESLTGKSIDILVNNAGFGLRPLFYKLNEGDIERMINLQTMCVARLTHFALKGMTKKNSGTIINISSDGAFAVIKHNVLYSSTKLFTLNLTEGIALELNDSNVKVQVVCPGLIDSDFHSSANMKVDKSEKGMFGFRNPDDIVIEAMKDLKKGKIVSVPDKGARMIKNLTRLMTRKMFYKFSLNFSKSMEKKK